MPLVQRFDEFVAELQQLERASPSLILETFTRHTPFEIGALYLRDGRESALRLAAKSHQYVGPEILELENALDLELVIPLRSQRESLGILALGRGEATEEDFAFARAGAS
ncbi:MAG TPA: hypothetical protein VN181_01235, partial [Thermoanaerobaculia bacterium]|nr:hypothetical protein [Thermoanaerobaculia bacterium]